jgi:hemerythrin
MSFEIPEPFCWDASFEVFYHSLDEEHKGLFQGIFKVAEDPKDEGALNDLKQKVKDHFTNEEGIMSSSNYEELPDHKILHADFVAKLDALTVPVGNDSVHFAKDWLVQHIKTTDFKYKGKLH